MLPSLSQEFIFSMDTNMLQVRCQNCDCAMEAGTVQSTRVQKRLLRTVRVICVSVTLLLVFVLAIMVLLLFGPTDSLRQSKETETLDNVPEPQKQRWGSAQGSSRPSALLTFDEEKRKWQTEMGNTHIRGGMTISSDLNLRVPTEGMYKLYLQMTFVFNHKNYQKKDEICGDEGLALNMSVQRLSPSYPVYRNLLVSQDTMSCTHGWTKTMSTSGSFILSANSLLKVNSPNWDLVNPQDIYTFFGAELLYTLN